MFHIDRPIARISPSLVLYRVPRSGSFTFLKDHHCGLEVKSLVLTQQARVRSPVGSIYLVEVFLGFSLNRKANFRIFWPHSSPVIIWPSYIIRLRTATVSDHSSSTWPSLNNKQQQHLWWRDRSQVSSFSFYLFAKEKETAARDPIPHLRWTYPCYRAGNTKYQQRWMRWWCTISSKHLAKGDKLR